MTDHERRVEMAPDLLAHLDAGRGPDARADLPPSQAGWRAPSSPTGAGVRLGQGVDPGRTEFLAMVLHELRSPLGVIRTAADLLRERNEIGDILHRAARQVGCLADDLIELCGVSRPTFKLRCEPVELRDVVSAAVAAGREALDRKNFLLAVDVPDRPVWVTGDAARLAAVLRNLLENAAKYTPAGGHIGLTLQAAVGEAVLRVRDTGIGIDPAALGQIFQPYVREGARGTPKIPGHGIGLALVQTFVALHGGTVTAASAGRGLGSEFVVRLPIAAAPPELDAPGRTVPPVGRSREADEKTR